MLESYGASDVGRRRSLNEDSFLIDEGLGLYVVADGMGGHNAGEVASKLAVDTVSNFVRRSRDEEITWPYGVDPTYSVNANRLRTAIMLANKRVWKEADNRQDYTGMGTTIVTAIVESDLITFAGAGDSRAYRYREGKLGQMTVDDSWVQVAISEGVLQPEEAERHPMKNIITKAIGAKDTIDLPIDEEKLLDDDVYLLCSDGLHGMVSDERIQELFRQSEGDLKDVIHDLIDEANENGGKDNVTALVIRYREDEA